MHKVINDPVHGFIAIDDSTVLDIIDSLPFQRLRHIRQMGIADMVYPGAEHTRFLHSLGAYHLMKKALDSLQTKGVEISPEEKLSAQLAILLHDVGHFPYSHALEESVIADVHHEDMSRAIMDFLNKKYNNVLHTAIEIYHDRYPKKWIHQLVSSHVDVDRMDYLVRDSFFTGVAEGMVGVERILQMMDVVNDKLVIEEKGIYSIDKFLIARRIMYSQVYSHKTVLGVEKLLINILRRARDIFREGKLSFCMEPLAFFFQNQITKTELAREDVITNFLNLTDASILSHIYQWQYDNDRVLSDLSDRLIARRIYKSKNVDSLEIPEEYITNFRSQHPDLVEFQDYYLFTVETDSKFYSTQEDSIPILYKDGTTRNLEDIQYSYTYRLQGSENQRKILYSI